MRHITRATTYCIALGCLVQATVYCHAQLMKEQPGPGLDPTPIQIPSVASARPRPITNLDLLQIRDVRGLSISPDGKQIAFIVSQAVLETNRYRTALFVVSTEPGSRAVSYGTIGPPFWSLLGQWLPEAPQWSPDSRFITYRLKSNGTWQIWEWHRDGGVPLQITHCPYDVQRYRWTADGEKIVYEAYLPQNPAKLEELRDNGVLLNEDIDAPWDIAVPIVEAKLERNSSPPQTWIRNLATGEERPATVEEQRVSSLYITSYNDMSKTGDGVWSPDHSKLVLVGTSSCGGHKCFPLVLKVHVAGPSRVLTPGVYYATDPHWRSDSSEIFFELHDSDGHVKPAVVTVATGAVHDLVTMPTETSLRDCSWDTTGRFGACTVQDPVTPPQVAWVDALARSWRVVADLNPEFKNVKLSPAIPMSWANDDHMHAHLILPVGFERGKRYPLVITMYRDGSSFLRGAVGDEYPIQVFAAHGMAVLNFDVGEFREFEEGDFQAALSMWQGPLRGIKTLIKDLATEGTIDPKRVAITGLSHGAEMAAYDISHSNLFSAAAMSQGGSDDLSGEFLQNGAEGREYWRKVGLVGPDGPRLNRWRVISASWHVADIHTPVLLNESDREYLYFMEFYGTLRDHHKPVEVWIYPNENHEKNQPKHRYAIYKRNLDWMMFWLLDKENPEPVDSGQYARWRQLRNTLKAGAH